MDLSYTVLLYVVQVEEVVTSYAPACKEGGKIFEMTFSVSQPAKNAEAEAMIASSQTAARTGTPQIEC